MNRTRVECLKIREFRRFSDIEVPLGSSVTLIAGQNGTSKSTLLGMLAQPFSFGVLRGRTARSADNSRYINTYHGLKLHDYHDLSGNPFMYDCDDVFRLSKKFDYGRDYQYTTQLAFPPSVTVHLEGDALLTKSRERRNGKGEISGMRFVTGPGASHESGEGNFPHPVLYLGLNRLWPLAKAKKCTFTTHSLSDEERSWYVAKYNETLCLDEHDNNAQFIDTAEKRRFITPQSSNYDGESCSAGQDNLSQVLTAILSFRRLKEKLGDRYRGGMLLIDELDATLHAFAQRKLLELLCRESCDLGLQVVATSHSLLLLEMAYRSELSRYVKPIYLVNNDGRIAIREFATYQDVCDHLKVETTREKRRPRKVSVVFEDEAGKFFFQQICGRKLRNYVKCYGGGSLGAGILKNLADASRELPEMKNLIFVPDGDMAKEWSRPPRNLLPLPGGARPETLVYRLLYGMCDRDPFWASCGSTYTRQVAIVKESGDPKKGDTKDWVKDWYRRHRQHWGRGDSRVYQAWVRANAADCLEFCKRFVKVLSGCYEGQIPKKVVEDVMAQFGAHS